MKTLLGYDCHRLKSAVNSHITIAGAKVNCDLEILAHSDGDVVYHAIADALSSNLLKKSIGEIFSDTDNANKARNSEDFVKIIYEMCDKPKILYIDVIVILETPQLWQYTELMRDNIARMLNMNSDDVSVRAKRREDDIKKISAILTLNIE